MEVTGTFCTFVSGVWWRDFEKQNNKAIKANKWDNRISRDKSEQSSGSDGLMHWYLEVPLSDNNLNLNLFSQITDKTETRRNMKVWVIIFY